MWANVLDSFVYKNSGLLLSQNIEPQSNPHTTLLGSEFSDNGAVPRMLMNAFPPTQRAWPVLLPWLPAMEGCNTVRIRNLQIIGVITFPAPPGSPMKYKVNYQFYSQI